MTAPETLAERLAKCVKPLDFGLSPDEGEWTLKWAAQEQQRHTARIIGALDTDAIARLVAEAVEKERAGCAEVADAYCEENRQMATDTIMIDPVLSSQGGPISAADWKKAEELTITGCVHTSMFHAAQNIAAAIRARASQTEKEG